MSLVTSVLLFSASLAGTVVFFVQAALSIKRREVYYEPNCPPIVFSNRPIAFIALCSLYVALGALFLFFTIEMSLELFRVI
jgi:hypothetical protein